MVKNANNKNLGVFVFPEFKQAYDQMLEELGIQNRSEYILSLIIADAEKRGYQLPAPTAPRGVRADSSVYPKRNQED